jgi:putative N6-adenine-specific DNA methylase
MLQVGKGRCSNEDDVYELARGVSWAALFRTDRSIKVQASATRCPGANPVFLSQRVKDGVCDRFRKDTGARPSVDTVHPDLRLRLHLVEDMATLYLDTSGESLFKRGYRRQTGDAPIRENLAAGILTLLGWQPGEVLLDPMCGSGTFLVEAGLIARRVAPGSRRRFAFEHLRVHDAPAWERMRGEARARETRARVPLHGSDISADCLEMASENLRYTGLDDTVRLERADCLDLEPPAASGLWLTNPPYGVRLEDAEELASLYPRWGDLLKRRFAGWRACFITADPALPSRIRLKSRRRTPLFNGALECRLLEYSMSAGGCRKVKTSDDDTTKG